jgi:hypothetical protein
MSGFSRGMSGMGGMGGMGGFPGGMGGGMGGDDFFGGGGRPQQGGFSSFSTFDSARPEGQQLQASHQPYGDYDDVQGYDSQQYELPRGQGGPMYAQEPRRSDGLFDDAIAARRDRRRQNPFGPQRQGGYAPSGYEQQASYQQQPQYAQQYEAPRGGPMAMGGGRRQQAPQDEYYGDEYADDGYYGDQQYQPQQQGYAPRQGQQQEHYYETRQAPQQGYGGGGCGRRDGGRPGPFQGGIWDDPNPFR